MTKVNIEISGDVGCGKSIVMYQIREMMFSKFGVDVKSPHLHSEMQLSNPDKPEGWQIESIKNTEWTMTESVNHSALENKMNTDRLETQNEEQPKRVKVEYVECDRLQDALDKFESMSGFEFYPDEHGAGDRINSVRYLALAYGNDSLYLKVVTEITERDEFIEMYAWATQDDKQNIEDIAGMLFDSGKFKLVEL